MARVAAAEVIPDQAQVSAAVGQGEAAGAAEHVGSDAAEPGALADAPEQVVGRLRYHRLTSAAGPSCARCWSPPCMRRADAPSSRILKNCRARLQGAGKPAKAALVATACKLLVTLDAMPAADTDHCRTSPS